MKIIGLGLPELMIMVLLLVVVVALVVVVIVKAVTRKDSTQVGDSADELMKHKELLENDVITQEEFETKKR